MSDRIEEIKERVDKATPGPWVFWSNIGVQCTEYDGRTSGKTLGPSNQGVKIGLLNQTLTKEDDSIFIAHSRDDIPYLLTRLASVEADNREHVLRADSLRAEIERLEEEQDEWAEALNDSKEFRVKYATAQDRVAHLEALLSRERLDELIDGIISERRREGEFFALSESKAMWQKAMLALADAIRKEAE
jgi:hypothetical protein